MSEIDKCFNCNVSYLINMGIRAGTASVEAYKSNPLEGSWKMAKHGLDMLSLYNNSCQILTNLRNVGILCSDCKHLPYFESPEEI